MGSAYLSNRQKGSSYRCNVLKEKSPPYQMKIEMGKLVREKSVSVNQLEFGEDVSHGRMNYKDTKPYMSAFLSVDLLTDFAAFCSTDL
jgi:hypothetical protein